MNKAFYMLNTSYWFSLGGIVRARTKKIETGYLVMFRSHIRLVRPVDYQFTEIELVKQTGADLQSQLKYQAKYVTHHDAAYLKEKYEFNLNDQFCLELKLEPISGAAKSADFLVVFTNENSLRMWAYLLETFLRLDNDINFPDLPHSHADTIYTENIFGIILNQTIASDELINEPNIVSYFSSSSTLNEIKEDENKYSLRFHPVHMLANKYAVLVKPFYDEHHFFEVFQIFLSFKFF